MNPEIQPTSPLDLAGVAVATPAFSPVAWVELVEALRDVSNSVLLGLLGNFVLEFMFFMIQ